MLDKTTMKAELVLLLRDMQTRDNDAVDDFATQLADIVEKFVKSATVTVAAGIPVSTAGTAAAQTGTTTATGTGQIN